MKLLNLTPAQRLNCTVEFNVNRFEVFLSDGCFLTAASSKSVLKIQLGDNEIINSKFSPIASRQYLCGYGD